MTYFLVFVIVVLMALTAITLIRGIVAFMQSTREDLERPDSAGPSAMQLKQNKLMFRRIMFQAAAIAAVAVLLKASQ